LCYLLTYSSCVKLMCINLSRSFGTHVKLNTIFQRYLWIFIRYTNRYIFKRYFDVFFFLFTILATPRISSKIDEAESLGAVWRPLTRARKLVARKWANVTARKQVGNIARSDRGLYVRCCWLRARSKLRHIWQRAVHLVIAMHRQFLRRI